MRNTRVKMKIQEKQSIRGVAAGRKSQRILSKLMAPSTQSFFQKINFRNGMKGLDLNCGEGDVTLELLDLIGEEKGMAGIDINATHINIAKERLIENKKHNVDYKLVEYDEWQVKKVFDFVYCRFLLSQLSYPQNILAKIFKSLVSGGFVMVEDLEYSNYHCFPSC